MKYIKASTILPAELLETIQEYAEGCVIYIPNRSGLRQSWGKSTEIRQQLQTRNSEMKNDHVSGLSVKSIAEKYHLAESTVKKIIYQK